MSPTPPTSQDGGEDLPLTTTISIITIIAASALGVGEAKHPFGEVVPIRTVIIIL